MLRPILLAAVVLSVTLETALAHISLKLKEAMVGVSYEATLRVPHGCEGKPTDTVKVRVPAGAVMVQPEAKAGWMFETVEGAYDRAYSVDGINIDRGIQQIIWTGGSLADKAYDEFEFALQLADSVSPGDVLYFPVVQQCGEEAERWIELPAAGENSADLQYPAPALRIVAKN
jgi:periplasmic copper chaperone A